jgi:ATP-dependent DNA helicase DinG
LNEKISAELASIIMPGCDDDVVAGYATLASRARVAQFGLLDDDVVVLDTETTGLDFKDCELIEVAAARLRGTQIVDTFDMFVHPDKPIPPEVVQITGITNDMVADAPCALDVCSQLRDFAQGAPIIAHNSTFDRHFMEKGMGGDSVGGPWIDSLQLSRIVLPCLSSHKLHDLSRAFGLHASTHRAIDDVIATCGLWRILLVAASDLPAGMCARLAQMYPDVEWGYRPIFAHMAAMAPDESFALVDARAQRCSQTAVSLREDARDVDENQGLAYPSDEQIRAAFAADGVVGKMYAGYEPRPEQVQMSLAVAQAYREGKPAALEAGTGVGKSIAYLLPSVLLARANGITVGVATKSNALADQLINRELPLLAKALGQDIDYTALKGFDNYPCLRKVAHLMRAGSRAGTAAAPQGQEGEADGQERPGRKLPEASPELLDAIAATLGFAVQSSFGDVTSLGVRWGKIQRSDLTSTSSECQKRRCPFFPNKCFLHLARKRAQASDVVVTNHSLLFRQVGSDIEVLPPARFWVVDEAHSAEAEARRQWAQRVNSRDVQAAFDLVGGSSSGALGTLARSAATKPGSTLMCGLITKAASEMARAFISSGLFFADLKTFCKKVSPKKAYDTQNIWIDAEIRAGEPWNAVEESGTAFAEVLGHALECARAIQEAMQDMTNPDPDLQDRMSELMSAVGDLSCIHTALELVLDGRDERYVYSASFTQRTGFEAYELVAESMDVGAQLAGSWYPDMKSVVYSSATVAVGDKFDHFAHEVGLDRVRGGYTSLKLASSYDFQNHMGIVVARDLPDPTKQKEAFLAQLPQLLVDIHLAMQGSVLTLFTNRAEMDRMYEIVAPQLAQHGLELACQSRKSNIRRISDHFVAEKSSSLFALKSFWEGFDAQGDTLRCVVIPRLPFTPPTEPVSLERKLREGKDSWRNHDLPESVLAFKQAAGRLIRSSTDKGTLVLADPRLTGMWYGKVFMASLPKKDVEVLNAAEVGDYLRSWREAHE